LSIAVKESVKNIESRELEEWRAMLSGRQADLITSEDLTPTDKAAIALIAMGSSKEITAQTLGIDAGDVSLLIASKAALDLLCKIQDGLGLTAEERLVKAANLAVSKQIALLNSDNERVAGEAARYIIDQAVGKSLQRAEIRSVSMTIDAQSIRSKYEAVQGQLRAIAKEREVLLRAKPGEVIDCEVANEN
jgi:hypothetical protein